MSEYKPWTLEWRGEGSWKFQAIMDGRCQVAVIEDRPGIDHENNSSLLVNSANSYRRHFADPVAAAEGDMLGQALEALKQLADEAQHFAVQHDYGKDLDDAVADANAILAKTKDKMMPTFPGETIDGQPAANWPAIQRECAKHKRFDITVEKHDPERQISLKQMAFFHANGDKDHEGGPLYILSQWNGDSKECWQTRLKLECGSQWFEPKPVIVGNVAYTMIPSKTKMSVKDFGDWYTNIKQHCEEKYGVMLPDPDPNWKTKGNE